MVEARKPYNIIAISGSLREKSTNTAILRLASELAPKDRVASVEILSYKDVPIYDGDIEAAGIPDSVKAIAKKIAEADGVYISTPENNYSISAALKNIIDWVTRVQPNPFEKKPVAIASVAAGPSGGVRAQDDVRKVLLYSNSIIMTSNTVAISANYLKFDKDANLTDEASKKAIQAQINAFVDWIDFTKNSTA